MKEERLKSIFREYSPNIQVCCDEYHQHYWDKGCFYSKCKESMIICEMYDHIRHLERRIQELEK